MESTAEFDTDGDGMIENQVVPTLAHIPFVMGFYANRVSLIRLMTYGLRRGCVQSVYFSYCTIRMTRTVMSTDYHCG